MNVYSLLTGLRRSMRCWQPKDSITHTILMATFSLPVELLDKICGGVQKIKYVLFTSSNKMKSVFFSCLWHLHPEMQNNKGSHVKSKLIHRPEGSNGAWYTYSSYLQVVRNLYSCLKRVHYLVLVDHTGEWVLIIVESWKINSSSQTAVIPEPTDLHGKEV